MKLGIKFSEETMNGGEIVTRLLAAEGVSRVFGIIDGTYMGMYGSFGAHGIDLITPRHESSAVHMAGAYARLTGELGVCIASNGPGVANALPGVAVEQTEGNRVLLITSSRRHGIVHPDRGGSFQCFPQQQVIAAMAKWSVHVPSADRIAELTRRALKMCFTGRPGLVHIDIPEDFMNGAVVVGGDTFRAPETYRMTEPMVPSPSPVERAARLLREAKRPILHAGSGVLHAGAFDLLRQVAARLHAPVTTSWAARAVIDERHELSMSMVYVDATNKTRREADLVLVLGSRLGETDWWGKKPYWGGDNQRIIQVDIDPETLGNIRGVELPIHADVAAFLEGLLARLEDQSADPTRSMWVGTLKKAKGKRRKQLDKHLSNRRLPMHTAHVPVVAQSVFGDDAIMVVDGGNTAIWANFYTEVRAPNSVVTTPKMGHLGAGVPQTVAAKVAHPDRPVYCIIGDGAMGFQPQEIETAVRHGLPVVWLVVCDRQWGMVKINQQFALRPIKTLVKGTLDPEENINTDLAEIEWDLVARAMGAHGERVADPDGLENALRRAVASGKPAVIHVDVDRVAHLWAPELKTFKDMHSEPAG